MIEFGERRQVIMSRPDKLRVDFERSDGDKGVTVLYSAAEPSAGGMASRV